MSEERRVCVAVTAAGSGIAQTVIDGLRTCPFPVRVVGFELAGRAKGLYDCDVAHRLPSPDDAGYVDQLTSVCQKEGVDLLIPCSDPELSRIAGAAPKLEQGGCRVVTSSPDCVRICRDKKALHDFMVENGVPFFSTWLACDVALDPSAIPYPAILKPRWGSGSVGVRILTSASDWTLVTMQNSLDTLESWVVQPLGRPSTWGDAEWQRVLEEGQLRRQDQLAVQLFVSESGHTIGRMTWLASLKSGVVTSIEVIDDPEIWRAVERVEEVVATLGVRGPLNIQGIRDGERTSFFEVNPRFSGSTGARALLGYREVEAAVRHFALGESEEDVKSLLTPRRRWVGLRQMAERAVPEVWVHRFESTGRLSLPFPLQRILVLGGSGYLGQEIVRALLDCHPHVEVVVPVRNREPMKRHWQEHPERGRLCLLDWSEVECCSPDLMADALIHTAAVRPPTAEDPSSLFAENLHLTRIATRAARLLAIPFFVFVSSHAVYEGERPPWTEETPVRPQSPYAYAKVACEELVRELAGHGIRYAILRMASLYGLAERMQWERVVHRFAEQAVKGGTLQVHGSGRQTLDLMHVKDGAQAICSLLEASDRAWNGTYNITSGAPIEVAALAQLCRDTARSVTGIEVALANREISRAPLSYGSSNQRAAEILEWSPTISLRTGLEEIMTRLWEERESESG